MRPAASTVLAVVFAVAAVAVFLLPLNNFWDWALSLTLGGVAVVLSFVAIGTRGRRDPRAATRVGR